MPAKQILLIVVLILSGSILSACGAPQLASATATIVQPSSTPILLPSASPIPPTLPPPTASPIPPTNTPIPPTPTPVPTATPALPYPSSRAYTSLAYDTESDRVILFGGQTGSYLKPESYNGETWAFQLSSKKWTRMNPTLAPSARSAPEMVYLSKSDRVILFGGGDLENGGLRDTWAYDFNSNTWTKLADGPKGLVGPDLAYDEESDKVILYGGSVQPKGNLSDQTWAYDFKSNTWKEMAPKKSPPGRNFAAMAYDSKADRVLMWDSVMDGSMWAYDYNANAWTEAKLGAGASPDNHGGYPQMVFSPKIGRMILFGGTTGGDLKETWAYEYKTNSWTNLKSTTSPGSLSRHSMVYLPTSDRIFLFGGHDNTVTQEYAYLSDSWIYDFQTNQWSKIVPSP